MKSITEQIEDLQAENESLQKLKKGFEKMTKEALGMTPDEIEKMAHSQDPDLMHFGSKIRKYFSLETKQDLDDFAKIMCSDSSRNYFMNHRGKDASSAGNGTGNQADTV